MQHPITIMSTTQIRPLADSVCAHLLGLGITSEHIPFTQETFACGEVWAQASRSVRNKEVYLLHDLYVPETNVAIMTYVLMTDALIRASVGSIHAVLPYLPYTRQDRKDKGRVPISAAVIARMIEQGGAVRHTMTFDLHADQEQGFFAGPVDVLRSDTLFTQHYQRVCDDMRRVIVVAPDVGASKRAQRFAQRLNVPLAIIDKRRSGPGTTSILHFLGPERLDGMTAILFDDICDSGGTLIEASRTLYQRGASEVHAAVAFALCTGHAEQRLRDAAIRLVTLDTIARDTAYKAANPDITFLPIDLFLAQVIAQNVIPEGSVSKLLE